MPWLIALVPAIFGWVILTIVTATVAIGIALFSAQILHVPLRSTFVSIGVRLMAVAASLLLAMSSGPDTGTTSTSPEPVQLDRSASVVVASDFVDAVVSGDERVPSVE